ncbi:MAG TPA: hypothetical protein VI298_14535 [Geobacteraceae bacterium]
MHVVVIHGWREETAEVVQAVAAALGVTVFEARQRMIGGGPAVVASFADPHQAGALAAKLNRSGVATLVVDVAEVRSGAGRINVRRFELGGASLRIEAGDGEPEGIPYGEIDLLLPGIGISGHTETTTVTERTFSLGRTIFSGGIPLTKKVERQQEVTTEQRTRLLFLYAGRRPQVVFSQSGMTYDGLGSAMKMSQELNFAYLAGELRRLSPGAAYDDRLLNRAGQVRLLGPALNPETSLDLAAEILARSLRCGVEKR